MMVAGGEKTAPEVLGGIGLAVDLDLVAAGDVGGEVAVQLGGVAGLDGDRRRVGRAR